MFAKPFRIKTQTAIRSSDRKKIKADIARAYPSLTDDMLAALFPNKEEMSTMKIYSHSGETVIVYCLKKTPIFFEIEKTIYPTVYTLWNHPDLLLTFTTYAPVVAKLIGGADLMLPGLVTDGPVLPGTFRHVNKGDVCQINTVENKAPIAVGRAAMSGSDMYDSGMRGKGVQVIHIYKDHLWAHGDQQEPPQLGPVTFSNTTSEDDKIDEASGGDHPPEVEETEPETRVENGDHEIEPGQEVTSTEIDEITTDLDRAGIVDDDRLLEENADEDEEEFEETQESMDALLYHCFMCAIRSDVKNEDLPVLTSKLLRTYMVPWCPPGRTLDLKKSSYKKLTKFLQAMVDKQLILVKELSKGVDSVTNVNRDNTLFKEFVIPEKPVVVTPEEATSSQNQKPYQPPKLEVLYAVSGNVLPIFKDSGITKGVTLLPAEVRRYVKEYVRANNLTVENDPRLVVMDGVLSDALLNKGERDVTHLQWEQLFKRCMEKMSDVTRITYPGKEPKVVKGKLQNIQLSVVQRSGNKKVTLIDHLDQFGIDEAAFAHELQIGVAGSTAVQSAPGKKGQQVLVQGNQVVFVADLLMGKYGLDKKYITGLDKAPKPKKKR